MTAVPSIMWVLGRSLPTTPGQQYLIKVEENSASSHLVPLQLHVLVKEQLVRKPERSRSAGFSAPSASYPLPHDVCGAHIGQWEAGVRKLRPQKLRVWPIAIKKSPLPESKGWPSAVPRSCWPPSPEEVT